MDTASPYVSHSPVLEPPSLESGEPHADACDAGDLLCNDDPEDDALLATQNVLTIVRKKLAFATHILEAAAFAPLFCDYEYQPLSLPH